MELLGGLLVLATCAQGLVLNVTRGKWTVSWDLAQGSFTLHKPDKLPCTSDWECYLEGILKSTGPKAVTETGTQEGPYSSWDAGENEDQREWARPTPTPRPWTRPSPSPRPSSRPWARPVDRKPASQRQRGAQESRPQATYARAPPRTSPSASFQDRNDHNVTFLLYTILNPKHPKVISPRKLKNLKYFNPLRKTKFLVPGYGDILGDKSWILELKTALLKHPEEFNVIVADFDQVGLVGMGGVGAALAAMAQQLQEVKFIGMSSCHVIARGSGVEAASLASRRMPGLGRITGLDPPADSDLSPTDAHFVDVIHTNDDEEDRPKTMGHMDFYPNSGRTQQACPPAPDFFKELASTKPSSGRAAAAVNQDCASYTAPDLFLASVNPVTPCLPLAVGCSSWERFTRGLCRVDSPVPMGFYADIVPRRPRPPLFLKTSGKPPYCVYQYKVKFQLRQGKKDHVFVQSADIRIHGTKGSFNYPIVSSPEKWELGGVYSFIVMTPAQPGRLVSATLHWKCDKFDMFDPMSWLTNQHWNFEDCDMDVARMKILPITLKKNKKIFRSCPQVRKPDKYTFVIPLSPLC